MQLSSSSFRFLVEKTKLITAFGKVEFITSEKGDVLPREQVLNTPLLPITTKIYSNIFSQKRRSTVKIAHCRETKNPWTTISNEKYLNFDEG